MRIEVNIQISLLIGWIAFSKHYFGNYTDRLFFFFFSFPFIFLSTWDGTKGPEKERRPQQRSCLKLAFGEKQSLTLAAATPVLSVRYTAMQIQTAGMWHQKSSFSSQFCYMNLPNCRQGSVVKQGWWQVLPPKPHQGILRFKVLMFVKALGKC